MMRETKSRNDSELYERMRDEGRRKKEEGVGT